jgi:hypothetical protein
MSPFFTVTRSTAARSLQKRASGHHQGLRPDAGPDFGIETLEARQLFSVTGFSLVDQASFPGSPTTVTSQPTVFQSTLQKSWLQLVGGQLKINGQTLGQTIASGIQQAESAQGLSAYNIGSGFDGTPVYNGTLKTTSSGGVLQLTFDAIGNQTTFTSTTNSIFGSWADPTFHVTYNLDLTIDLSLPSNLSGGKVTATAFATTSDVTVSTSNVLVGLSDIFGADIPGKIAAGINGQSQNISSVVPTGLLNTALQLEAAQGYTHLQIGLDSGGNLLLTAQKPTLLVNGITNDHISISSGSRGSVVIAASGQTGTFQGGLLKTIVVNNAGVGTNTVAIPSLPSGVAVQVKDSSAANDTVTVGGTGSLANVAGTVSVSNSSGNTSLTVNDVNDTAASKLGVTGDAVQFNGRTVVTYSTTNQSKTTLTVDANRTDTTTVDSSSTPVNINGLGGTVTVGDGSLSALGGTVNVSNLGTVDIDDSNDKTQRNVDLTTTMGGLGLSSSAVAFDGLSTIDLFLVKDVNIYDGASDGLFGDNTFDAQGSPSNDFFTIFGHLGDQVTGPAAGQVDLNAPLLSWPKVP